MSPTPHCPSCTGTGSTTKHPGGPCETCGGDRAKTIRVWWSGPIHVMDAHGERIEGEFSDLHPETRAGWELTPGGALGGWTWETIASLQVKVSPLESTRAYIQRGDACPSAVIESLVDTRIRHAVLAERERCAKVAKDLGPPNADANEVWGRIAAAILSWTYP